MPQYLTLNIGAKVDKGPEIKSEAKFEILNYAALVEEQICKCNSTTPPFDLPEFKTTGLQLLVSSDKYSVDKECIPLPSSAQNCEKKKNVSFRLLYPMQKDPSGKLMDKDADGKPVVRKHTGWMSLLRPQILASNDLKHSFDGIEFKNDLTIDVKVSVLIFRINMDLCQQPTEE
jgi:hypothetical protein